MANQTTQSLFTKNETIETGNGTFSRIASMYTRGQCAIFVDNSGARTVTFEVYVGAAEVGQAGGRNSLPQNAKADSLFPLLGDDLSSVVTFTVAAGARAAIDLAPFSPEFLGLKAVATGGSATDVTAYAYSHS